MNLDEILKAVSRRGLRRNLGKKTLSPDQAKKQIQELMLGEILENLTQAHMKGYHKCCQRDASYSIARADCRDLAKAISNKMKEKMG